MKIYNTLTRKIEEFIPNNKNEITMYMTKRIITKKNITSVTMLNAFESLFIFPLL